MTLPPNPEGSGEVPDFESTHLRLTGRGMRVGMPKCQRCGVELGSLKSKRTDCVPESPSSPPATPEDKTKMQDRVDEETERLLTEHAEDWKIVGEWAPRSDFDDHMSTGYDEYRAIAEKSSVELLAHSRRIHTVANLALEIVRDCRTALELPKGVSLTETIVALQEARAHV